ncbi:MAG: hypothetical protein JWO38_5712 [Gemmataceae bacterium]|nr:hypothetical protein [Gemmataceae bacterium]
MTEAEWLAATDPTPMLEFAQDRTTGRRFRLFACGCCRLVRADLPDPVCLAAVRAAERFADGRAGVAEFAAAHHAVRRAIPHGQLSPIGSDAIAAAFHASYLGPDSSGGDATGDAVRVESFISAVTAARFVPKVLARRMPYRVAREVVSGCLRCVVGNPFRPVVVEPGWRTTTVVTLARQMYESRDFAPMPILADALQDASCENPDIPAHCRGEGPHVRGCWVVDLILGNE